MSASHRFCRALVVGCGRSGLAAAELLVHSGSEVRLFDQRPAPSLPPRLSPCATYFGHDAAPDEAFAGIDLLLLSPGVPPGPWREQHKRLAPVAAIHGELSLALAHVAAQWAAQWPEGASVPTVLITGTNGKSTVTALTGAMLEAGGLRPFVGGNLGVPLSERALEVATGQSSPPGALVLECSSYQLETLRPAPEAPATSVAMVLNVSPDHLARYDSLTHYARTKAQIFAGLGPDALALTLAEGAFVAELRAAVPARATHRAVAGKQPPRLGPEDRLELGPDETYARDELPLAGRHNALNALFSLAAARHLGVSAQACAAALREFTALPHRMNPIAEHEGVIYFDDSKATNVASVLAALDGFERPFVLICGGLAKDGDDLGVLREALARSGRGLVALGESAQAFLNMAQGLVPSAHASDMHEAVRRARAMAEPGDAVLLSPACASWDMYSSFVHRGQVFAAAVEALASPGAE